MIHIYNHSLRVQELVDQFKDLLKIFPDSKPRPDLITIDFDKKEIVAHEVEPLAYDTKGVIKLKASVYKTYPNPFSKVCFWIGEKECLEVNLKEDISTIKEQIDRFNITMKFTTPKHYPHPYPQVCQYCHSSWNSRVEHPIQCPACHRSVVKVSSKRIEGERCLEACQELDVYIRKTGSYIKDFPIFKKRWIFTSKEDGGIHYQRFEEGKEIENRIIQSTYEVLKEFDWQQFMPK